MAKSPSLPTAQAAKTQGAKVAAPAPKAAPKAPRAALAPGVPLLAAAQIPHNPQAVDLETFTGKTYVKTGDGPDKGQEMQLKIVEDDPHGKTHKLKNETYFWEGTEEEFKANFEKA